MTDKDPKAAAKAPATPTPAAKSADKPVFDPRATDPKSDTLEPLSTSQTTPPLPETYSPPSPAHPEEVSREDFHLAPVGHRDYVAGQPVDEDELALTTAAADRKLEAARADAKRRDERSAHRSPRSPDDPNQHPGAFDDPDYSPPARFDDDKGKKKGKDEP